MLDVESHKTSPAPEEPDDQLEPFRGRRSYLSLTTYRRDGSAVTTPVWCVVDDNRVLMRTDSESHKVKRLRRNPSVSIAACDSRGTLRSQSIPAAAEELPTTERKRIERLLLRKYPVGLGAEIAFLRPVHSLAAALGRGRKRGSPLFFAIRPIRSSSIGRMMFAALPWASDLVSTAAAAV
jgi:PPOX class probable F420-dependent enzyme